MSAPTCRNCSHWQPDTSDPRMVRLGFAHCGKRYAPGRTFSGTNRCDSFAPMSADQLDARRKVAAERVQQLNEKEAARGSQK
ncbi:hypothetical protein [Delftia sp. WSY_7]|uniref:hypothetical protein n=1 Tax=Delftia sp. WSY_7 TaxID=3367202 RepID=UPI00370B5ECE